MYCVIMAGGSGTRFWPRSREEKSKQFLSIFGKRSLIQNTVKRFLTMVRWEDMYIVSRTSQKEELEKQVPEIPRENLLFEPLGKNTAPCIGLAALFVQQRNNNGILLVSPADHLIRKEANFRKVVIAGAQLAEKESSLVTIGIPPNRPSTGYGYIQINEEVKLINGIGSYRVKTFAEKPNLATAQRFLKSGDFFWNSGIFIFKASVLLQAIKKFLPDLFDGLMEIRKSLGESDYEDVLQRVYQRIKSVSIDYGIMEKAKNVYLVKGDFIWDDLGSWEQVYKLTQKDKNGNAVTGNILLLDTSNSYVYASKGVVSVIGMEDVIIVQEGGATLVCKKEKAEDVKQVVDRLKRRKLLKYI